MKLLKNKGSSSIMFIDGKEHKMLLPSSEIMIEDVDEADRLLKFYGFLEEIKFEKEVEEEKPKKKRSPRRKKIESFED